MFASKRYVTVTATAPVKSGLLSLAVTSRDRMLPLNTFLRPPALPLRKLFNKSPIRDRRSVVSMCVCEGREATFALYLACVCLLFAAQLPCALSVSVRSR